MGAHHLDEVLLLLRHVLNGVALSLEVLQHPVDAAKNIEVGCCSYVALVGRETENGDGHLLLSYLLFGQTALDTVKLGA